MPGPPLLRQPSGTEFNIHQPLRGGGSQLCVHACACVCVCTTHVCKQVYAGLRSPVCLYVLVWGCVKCPMHVGTCALTGVYVCMHVCECVKEVLYLLLLSLDCVPGLSLQQAAHPPGQKHLKNSECLECGCSLSIPSAQGWQATPSLDLRKDEGHLGGGRESARWGWQAVSRIPVQSPMALGPAVWAL